jgi:diphthamide synthase (EF-2-diphthine--ammonia ligase)
VTHFIFGDIFLHDVKTYREKQLAPRGITVVEPLWGKSSAEIMQEFLESGLQTIVVTTMADLLDEHFIGRRVDKAFIEDLPAGTDVCGENGEYHTFCHAGPIFRYPIPFSPGKPLKMTFPVKLDDGSEKDYSYWFANLETVPST